MEVRCGWRKRGLLIRTGNSLPGAAGSLWMMPWNAGLACWLMRRLGALSVGELDRVSFGRCASRRPERAPADPILIGAAPARAVTDDQFLLLEHLQSFHGHVPGQPNAGGHLFDRHADAGRSG